MGERAARGADHRVEPDAETPGLHHYLLGGQDVTEPAERRMPRGGMDHVRAATLVGQRLGAPLQRRVGRGCTTRKLGILPLGVLGEP